MIRGKKEGEGISVLTYHGLVEFETTGRESERFWVSKAAFTGHLMQIKQHGLRSQTLTESRRTIQSKEDIVITFDDGRASDYDIAFPVLANSRSKADFFINTAKIGEPGFLSWAQMKEMSEAGMSFQSHGHEHVDHSRLSASELRRQLLVSKQEIENRIGAPVEFFAAPYGEWNRRMVDVACEVGYKSVCTTEGQLADCQSHVIDRIGVDGMTSARDITAILTRDSRFFASRAVQFRLKRVPKKVVMQLFPGVMKAWRDRHHE